MDSTEQNMTQSIRRHDIDWLRVILFGLLVPFHIAIGVYWTTYGDHVNPNINDTEVDSAIDEERNPYTGESVDPMSLFLHWMHQWRLAALFMISGMGTAFAFRRRTWKVFSVERIKRLWCQWLSVCGPLVLQWTSHQINRGWWWKHWRVPKRLD